MIEIQWTVLEHNELPISVKKEIAGLKDQHWKYGMQSQIKWIDENIQPNDLHLVGRMKNTEDDFLCAYLNMIQVNVLFDEILYECLGIGNVCVDKRCEHAGYGIKLIKHANQILKQKNKQGVLLCKDMLLAFYSKCGWNQIKLAETYVVSEKYTHKLMVYPEMAQQVKKIKINRNF